MTNYTTRDMTERVPPRRTGKQTGEQAGRNARLFLSVLLKNARKIVSRDEFIDELWQSDEFVDDNTLTVNVNRLRKNLDL